MKILSSIRNVFLAVAVVGAIAILFTSCHREGCPNKITQAVSPLLEPAS